MPYLATQTWLLLLWCTLSGWLLLAAPSLAANSSVLIAAATAPPLVAIDRSTVKPSTGATTSLPAEVTHLTLWHGVNPPRNRIVLQQLVAQFNQTHPHIQVEPLYIGQPDQQLPKILAAIVGHAPPDLLWYAPTLTGRLLDLEALCPLDDWLQGPLAADLDPTLLSSMTLEGHLWSVPFGTNNVGIYYRPSLFDQAGITELPKTWEDLRRVARQLSHDWNHDGRPDQYGLLLPLGKGEWSVFTWLPFFWSAGGEITITTKVAETIQLDPSGAIAALQLWQDLLTDGSAVLSAPERGYELDKFLAGKVAMQLSGPWTLEQLVATGVDFGVMPIPTGQQRATVIGGENLFVLRTTSAHQQAALQFLEFVLSESFQTQWAMGTGYLPVNLKARQSAAYQRYVAQNPALKIFLEQAAFGRSRPLFAGYNHLSESLGRAIEAVLLQKSTPQEALQAAQKRLELAGFVVDRK